MKKALPELNEVFLYEKNGAIHNWDVFAEEVVDAVNKGLGDEPISSLVIQKLHEWMSRYLEDGVTEEFLNELNSDLHEVRYSKYILPIDIRPAETEFPQNGYVAQYDEALKPESYAADDFSKLLTSGKLRRLKRCQLEGCENFFLGPPQAKWCSKVCGSKFRVREMRKRDSS